MRWKALPLPKANPETPKQSHEEKSPLACGQGKLNAVQPTKHSNTVSLRLLANGNSEHLGTVYTRRHENDSSRTSLTHQNDFFSKMPIIHHTGIIRISYGYIRIRGHGKHDYLRTEHDRPMTRRLSIFSKGEKKKIAWALLRPCVCLCARSRLSVHLRCKARSFLTSTITSSALESILAFIMGSFTSW